VLPNRTMKITSERLRKIDQRRNGNAQLLHGAVHAVHVAADEAAQGQRQLAPLNALDGIELNGNAACEAAFAHQLALVRQPPVALLLDEGCFEHSGISRPGPSRRSFLGAGAQTSRLFSAGRFAVELGRLGLRRLQRYSHYGYRNITPGGTSGPAPLVKHPLTRPNLC